MTEKANYKELYLKMMRASEEAIRSLIQAQQECEELYLLSEEAPKLIQLIENHPQPTTDPANTRQILIMVIIFSKLKVKMHNFRLSF